MGAGASVPSDVAACELELTIVAGKDLIAKDGGMFSKATSDPFVKATIGHMVLGQTPHVENNLNPEWNADLCTDTDVSAAAMQGGGAILLAIFDYDAMSGSDPMGVVSIDVADLVDGRPLDKWLDVMPCDGCKKAKGQLHVKTSVSMRKALVLSGDDVVPVGGQLLCGMGWDMIGGYGAVDVDTSCVAMSAEGKVLLDECVYFADLVNSNGTVRHTGDEREGDAMLNVPGGDDEIITIDLDRVSPKVKALFLIGTVATEGKTFAELKTARMRLVTLPAGKEICRCCPALTGDSTAQFLCRIARDDKGAWKLSNIGDIDKNARDFGSLLPEIQGYMSDLVPGLTPDPDARVALMRKGGVVKLSDYNQGQPLGMCTFGLSWDVTGGKNIDLDASAILLDGGLQCVDTVFFNHLRSNDGSIQHGGDEREGDAKGDDEKIHVNLPAVPPHVRAIGFVINSCVAVRARGSRGGG